MDTGSVEVEFLKEFFKAVLVSSFVGTVVLVCFFVALGH